MDLEFSLEMFLVNLLIIIFRALVALVLSATTLHFALRALDSLTSGIDEWKEIKEGNVAMGVLALSVLVSVFLLVSPRIEQVVMSISPNLSSLNMIGLLAFMLFNFLLSLGAAVFVIFMAFSLVDRLTHDLDEFAELKKGNLAVALVMGVSILLITLAVKVPFDTVFIVFEWLEIALL